MVNPLYALAVVLGTGIGLAIPDMVGPELVGLLYPGTQLHARPMAARVGGGGQNAIAAPTKAWVFIGNYDCSAYDAPCDICCPGYGTHFADGTLVSSVQPGANGLRILAAPKGYKFGTILWVEGVGRCVVRDRGSAITEGKLDLYFPEGHQAALSWGRQSKRVWRLGP